MIATTYKHTDPPPPSLGTVREREGQLLLVTRREEKHVIQLSQVTGGKYTLITVGGDDGGGNRWDEKAWRSDENFNEVIAYLKQSFRGAKIHLAVGNLEVVVGEEV